MTEDVSREVVQTDPRRHDLDALRAFAMLLGIALHAALSFMDSPWMVQDQSRSPWFGLFVMAVHGFRMPLFFLLSGYFTMMLCRKRGLQGLLRHRAKRIALPLVLGCLIIVPLILLIVNWAITSSTASTESDPGSPPGLVANADIWTAAKSGDIAAVRQFIADGASLDGHDPNFGVTPLGMAALGNQPEVIGILLDAGADPSGRYQDQNTPLHTSAFFGYDEVAMKLLDAGGDFKARNAQSETPGDSMGHGKATTEFIAGILKMTIDFEAVEAGRDRIRQWVEEEPPSQFSVVMQWLLFFPFFQHLWFLWFLCWLVTGFALVTLASRLVPRLALPSILIATPLCLLWLVPLTMVTQSVMNSGGTIPGFGPDTSAGILPIPHVLAYYAIFFGFGALMYNVPGAADRLGQSWWIQLPLAALIFPFALGLAIQAEWTQELIRNEYLFRVLATLGQVLYAWLMIFGLMGLFEKVLSRERPQVRYISDSSYWLYLVHLPLIIAGQVLLRNVNLPAFVKFSLLLGVTLVILLGSYQFLVRYSWVGRLLNGPRARPPVVGVE
ncbi:MAG: acyltransferase family protein [Planctomycetota bacterium]|nr:acyltransferase family protein [Planctomycetota bacterium]